MNGTSSQSCFCEAGRQCCEARGVREGKPMATRNPHAAGLSRAAAIRALHVYRSARNRAEHAGADLALLVEPADFHTLDAAYSGLVEEFIDERIDCVSSARSALGLLAQIITDQQLGRVVDEGAPVSEEKNNLDSLRLISRLSGWVNSVDIAEGIAEERAIAVPTPPLDESRKAEPAPPRRRDCCRVWRPAARGDKRGVYWGRASTCRTATSVQSAAP
jgi:hypothetical protein